MRKKTGPEQQRVGNNKGAIEKERGGSHIPLANSWNARGNDTTNRDTMFVSFGFPSPYKASIKAVSTLDRRDLFSPCSVGHTQSIVKGEGEILGKAPLGDKR